jgi:hypothetical protein
MKTSIPFKILLPALLLLLHFNASAQCSGISNFPTGTITGPSPGQSVLVATNNFSGDYYDVYFNNDVNLRITSSIVTDIFYLEDMSTGSFIAGGAYSTYSNFAVFIPAGAIIRIHVWSSSNCVADAINRTITLIGIQPCISTVNSSSTFVYNAPANGVPENIFLQFPSQPYCSYAGEFTQVNFQPGRYKIESSILTDNVTVTSTASNIFNADTGFVTVEFLSANIRNIHISADANCTSDASCRNIIITCLTCTTAPTVSTIAATNVVQTSATLNGSANANNNSNCSVAFEWGTTTSYGNTTSPATAISGSTSTAVTANITGLNTNTVYNYRTVLTRPGQSNIYGSNQTFTTSQLIAPTVSTSAATNVVQTSATLNGSANANNNSNCSVAFEWGTTTSYGNTTSPAAPVTGANSTPVSFNLTGLTPGTTYNYRAVLSRPGQSSVIGSNQTFTTTTPTSSQQLFVTNVAFDNLSNAIALYQSQPTGAATYLNISVPSSQLDLPSATNMVFPTSNPKNFVSPGRTVNIYTKVRNQLINGQSTSLTLLKMRKSGVDPYITIIDSTSNVNNVAWGNSLWQDDSDPFTFQIASNTPPGHVVIFDFVVTEAGQPYTTYAVKVPVNPFVCTAFGPTGGNDSWFADDPSPDSQGNNNGIIEPTERIETKIDFDNITNFSFDYLFGELISPNAFIQIKNNWQGNSGNVSSKDWWNPFQSTLNTIDPNQSSITSTTDKVFDYNVSFTGEFNLLVNQSVIYSSIGTNRTYIKYSVPTVPYNQGYAPVRIDETKKGTDFKVYPNPSNGLYNIVCNVNLNAEITDVTGRVITKIKNVKNIDISNQACGVYFLKLSDEKSGLQKIIELIKK